MPQTTMPQTTMPQTTMPQTTMPQTTIPKTTMPQTTIPKTTMPQTTMPQTTMPQTTMPQTTMPQTTMPQTTMPQTSIPKTTMPQTTMPENNISASSDLSFGQFTGLSLPGTASVGFKNVESFTDFDKKYFNQLMTPTSGAINSSLSHTYDPNVAQFDNSSLNILGELYKIEKQIEALEATLKIQYADNKYSQPFKGIESKYNGSKIAVQEIQVNASSTPGDYNTKYMVKANDGCLSAPGNNNYKITKCNPNDKTQHFDGKSIYGNEDYAKTIDFGTISEDTTYPFLIMQSQSNRNCLTSKPGGLSVEPCTGIVNQQWVPF
jgi:hypothetical protein